MDESDTEKSRWRLSRYAPPDTDEVQQLQQQLADERQRVATLASALQQMLDAVEHLGRTMEKVGKQ